MKQMLDELKLVPGVAGTCVYDSGTGIVVSNLPGFFKPERLATVGTHLTKLFSAGRVSFADLADVSLHYDESVIVARELQENLLLFAICDPTFKHNLLSMSFNLLQEEIEKDGFTPVTAVVGLTESASSPSGSDERLPGLLGAMKELLCKVLGPMAGFIFEEALEIWEGQDSVEIGSIENLIELLNREIADPEKIDQYRKLITPELRSLLKG